MNRDVKRPPIKRLYSEADMIKITGLSRVTLWRLRKEGKLPYRQVGARVLYGEDDVQAFFDNIKGNSSK